MLIAADRNALENDHSRGDRAMLAGEQDRDSTGSARIMLYGLMLGAAVGVVVGISLNNIGLGISIGAGAGIVFGLLLTKHKKKADAETP